MEVKINKEIRNYTESMFFGLSLRQFIFSVLACGVAVGVLRARKNLSHTRPRRNRQRGRTQLNDKEVLFIWKLR